MLRGQGDSWLYCSEPNLGREFNHYKTVKGGEIVNYIELL